MQKKKPTPKQRLVLEHLLERPEQRLFRSSDGSMIASSSGTTFCGLTVSAMIRHGWLYDGGPLAGLGLTDSGQIQAELSIGNSIAASEQRAKAEQRKEQAQ